MNSEAHKVHTHTSCILNRRFKMNWCVFVQTVQNVHPCTCAWAVSALSNTHRLWMKIRIIIVNTFLNANLYVGTRVKYIYVHYSPSFEIWMYIFQIYPHKYAFKKHTILRRSNQIFMCMCVCLFWFLRQAHIIANIQSM